MGGEGWVPEDSDFVGQDNELAEVRDRARAFETAHHAKVRLEAMEIGEEDDPGFVVLRGRGEDVAGEWDGRFEERVLALDIAGIKCGKCSGGGRGYGVEDAEEGVAVAEFIAEYQAVVVEVVAGVHADPGGELAAHGDL